MTRLLICGSRTWDDARFIRSVLASFDPWEGGGLTVIEGGQRGRDERGNPRGADLFAERAARALGIPVVTLPADWSVGKRGGPERNARMLTEGRPDRVLAFADHLSTSKGTLGMCRLALAAGVPVTHAWHAADGMWMTRELGAEDVL